MTYFAVDDKFGVTSGSGLTHKGSEILLVEEQTKRKTKVEDEIVPGDL
jgi:hypothetical protein